MKNWKHRKYIRLILLFTIILVGAFILHEHTTYADVGNSVSRQKRGSSSSWGGSYSADAGFSSGMILWIVRLLFANPTVGIVVIVILILSRKKITRGGNPKYDYPAYDAPVIPRRDQQSIAQLQQIDPYFSEQNFISKINNMYVQLQQAWTKKEWKSIRPFETDALFRVHEKQLQQYIDRSQTNYVDNIAILNTQVLRYYADGVNDHVDVLIKVRINDYIVDDETGKTIVGKPYEEIYMTYIWKMIRRKGVITKLDSDKGDVTQCPNCGANVSINQSGECEYCSSTISQGDYDWLLSEIEVVEQR